MARRQKIIAGSLGGFVLLVLLVAWIDGGREDLREITQPVALPEGAQ